MERKRGNSMTADSLEAYFAPYRAEIIGQDQWFPTPYGKRRILYADWTASGRLYRPIEECLQQRFGPYVGNTHTETSVTGTLMTHAYHYARQRIREHVNAGPGDVLITACSGMTRLVAKLQRILGLRIPERAPVQMSLPEGERPLVIVSHMEHHSNHTSWLETIADVAWLEPDSAGLVCPDRLEAELESHADRRIKIGAFTACSNVTGIETPYHALARIMHRHGGWCFVDFAASGPYVPIDMHPADPEERLDAIFFSPHKFLGGPGSAAVLVFSSDLYKNRVPDVCGGGTVEWTNPWGEHSYFSDIEMREDGGTPAFLQTIRTALAIGLKEEMGPDRMLAREHELVQRAMEKLQDIRGLRVLAASVVHRLGIISFSVDEVHFNLMVRLLNDRFGIQVRGGCSCAGTYGHYLLSVSYAQSHRITAMIEEGDLSSKPGWVRLSLHPTMSNDEVDFACDAIEQIVTNIEAWQKDYCYDSESNEWVHPRGPGISVSSWFELA